MKFSHYLTRFLILAIFVPFISSAQNSNIVKLTKHIGFTLDAEENKYYEVFTNIPSFESAQFFHSNSDTIESRISYLEFTRIKISTKKFTVKSFVDLQIRLNTMPPITEDIRESYRKNLTYLRTKDILSNIPNGQFIEVNHINGKKVKNLYSGYSNSGYHTIEWDGQSNSFNDVPSGIYIVGFTYDNNTITNKVVKIK